MIIYKDHTPAIFYSIAGATAVQGKMEEQDDIVSTVTTKRVRKGEMTGYVVVCKDVDGLIFQVSNDMVNRLYGRATQ